MNNKCIQFCFVPLMSLLYDKNKYQRNNCKKVYNRYFNPQRRS